MTMKSNNEQQKRGDRTPIWRHAAKGKTMEGKCREGPWLDPFKVVRGRRKKSALAVHCFVDDLAGEMGREHFDEVVGIAAQITVLANADSRCA
jgi:hypothetical protein